MLNLFPPKLVNLDKLRKKIDIADTQLLELLSDRASLAQQIGKYKKLNQQEIYSPSREESLLRSLIQRNNGVLSSKSIRAIYREIMSASLHLEGDLSIAYLGPQASWSHQAAREKFGQSIEYYLPCSSIDELFEKVTQQKATYGIAPIENSEAGSVSKTLDLLEQSSLKICSQILLPVNHCALGIAESSLEKIYHVSSHPQALEQCSQWLDRYLKPTEQIKSNPTTDKNPKWQTATPSTSFAAVLLSRTKNKEEIAIGTPLAAEIYNLKILAHNIQNSQTNVTRFIVVSNSIAQPTGKDITSITFSLDDKPGSLMEMLGSFSNSGINLSKIHSRPSKSKNWEYQFFIDLGGHCEEEPLLSALNKAKKHCSSFRVLGSYPKQDC